MKLVRSILVAFVAAAVLAPAALPAAASSQALRSTVTVRGSDYGRVLFDGRGRALYAFTKDPPRRSVCSGDCAVAWPPYLVQGKVSAAPGAKTSLLGAARRADGKLQATYAGRPLYYYVRDLHAGRITCQNVSEFGGLWLVVRPSGTLVR